MIYPATAFITRKKLFLKPFVLNAFEGDKLKQRSQECTFKESHLQDADPAFFTVMHNP